WQIIENIRSVIRIYKFYEGGNSFRREILKKFFPCIFIQFSKYLGTCFLIQQIKNIFGIVIVKLLQNRGNVSHIHPIKGALNKAYVLVIYSLFKLVQILLRQFKCHCIFHAPSVFKVSDTKSSTDNCSALLSSKSNFTTSGGKLIAFKAFRNVFLLFWNPCFTSLLNSTSSQPSSSLSFRFNLITADLTFGGGLNTSGSTVNKYSIS